MTDLVGLLDAHRDAILASLLPATAEAQAALTKLYNIQATQQALLDAGVPSLLAEAHGQAVADWFQGRCDATAIIDAREGILNPEASSKPAPTSDLHDLHPDVLTCGARRGTYCRDNGCGWCRGAHVYEGKKTHAIGECEASLSTSTPDLVELIEAVYYTARDHGTSGLKGGPRCDAAHAALRRAREAAEATSASSTSVPAPAPLTVGAALADARMQDGSHELHITHPHPGSLSIRIRIIDDALWWQYARSKGWREARRLPASQLSAGVYAWPCRLVPREASQPAPDPS